MIVKYRANVYNIYKYVFDRENEKSLFSGSTRVAKKKDNAEYVDTLEEAKTFIIKRNEARIRQAEAEITRLKEHINKISKLTEQDIRFYEDD